MRIGIITAMADETMPLYEKLGKAKGEGKVAGATVHQFEIDGNEIYLAKSGVGEIRAALTAQMLVDIFEVEAILNFGFVGSDAYDTFGEGFKPFPEEDSMPTE